MSQLNIVEYVCMALLHDHVAMATIAAVQSGPVA